jgi:hypothetical protein
LCLLPCLENSSIPGQGCSGSMKSTGAHRRRSGRDCGSWRSTSSLRTPRCVIAFVCCKTIAPPNGPG